MATEADIVYQVRRDLGDIGEPFRTSAPGDGETTAFDLPVGLVTSSTFTAFVITNSSTVDLTPADYTLDIDNSLIILNTALAAGSTLITQGMATSLFTDEELARFVHDAIGLHTAGGATTQTYRYRDVDGFIHYDTRPVTLESVPEVEEILIVLLATIEALWALSTDAATDIDITTAEGTFVARSQRYAQIRSQIDVLTEKYRTLAQQLNVGLFRIEISNLRRISRTTGKLVPIYVAQEFDDYSWPVRILPPIDSVHSEDEGTPPSSIPVADVSAVAGDDFGMDVDLEIDLTGATVLASVKGMNPSTALQYFVVTVTDAVAGKITLTLTPYQTAHLGSSGHYDVQVTNSAGKISTELKGTIFVEPQTTPSGTGGQIALVDPWNIPGWTVNNS